MKYNPKQTTIISFCLISLLIINQYSIHFHSAFSLLLTFLKLSLLTYLLIMPFLHFLKVRMCNPNLLLPLIIFFAINVLDPLPKGSYLKRFDSSKWIEENTWISSPTKRRLMLGDLFWIKSKGWNENDLEKNLGKSSNYFQSFIDNKTIFKVYSYRIDDEDGFLALDSCWIVFFIDNYGKILKKRIYTD